MKYNKMVASSAFEACKIGDIETLKKLPRVVESLVDNNGACCLHYASRGGSLAVVEYLVKSLNFSVLVRTKTGATALHDAAAKGNTAIVKWFIENADVNANEQDGAGVTALHLAARYCHFLTVEWLLDEANADASIRSSSGALPLHFAVVGGDMNCVKILVDENPRLINMQMNNGAAPVYLASQAGRLDILKYLISRNGATKVKAYDAMSCLHAAAQMGHLDIVKWLITVDKCNPNDRDFDGTTPLHFAAGRGHAELVRWLLKEGGARITLDNLGGSPLHTAAELGELQCVQALLDCGCDVTLTDNAGLTAAELADKCEQTEAAALIRGEVSLADLDLKTSNPHQANQIQNQHFSHRSHPPPTSFLPKDLHTSHKATNIRSNHSHSPASPPLPPQPAHIRSFGSTPSSLDSPITPPTPIHEDENEPVAGLGYGYSSVKKSSQEGYSSSERPVFKRTVSTVSVDSSASNFGVFEQKDAGVIHTVTAEVHKAPTFVPPTPRPVILPSVPGYGSLNSTQESIVFSTSSSSFSPDDSYSSLDKNLVAQKTAKFSTGFKDKGSSELHNWKLPTPPLAHSTLSSKRDLQENDRSADLTKTQDSTQHSSSSSSSHSISESQEVDKFQYYYTPYKKDFNTVTKSSFAKAKALFQYNQVTSSQICPDSGEVCTKSDLDHSSQNTVSLSSKMDTQTAGKPEENHVKPVSSGTTMTSSNSSQVSPNQNAMKSVITIQGRQATIISTGSKPNKQEENTVRASALSSITTQPASSVHIQKDNVMKELRSQNVSQTANSAGSTTPVLVNGHVKTNGTPLNHVVHSSASKVVPVPLHLSVNGNGVTREDKFTSPRNLSRSSSASSTSSQGYSPVESKHNLIADIHSAVSGTSSLSLRRAKSRGEGVSMVYQSKKGGAGPAEVKTDHQPLSGQFDPKLFLDKVEKVDSTGRVIPEWRRQVLAKHLAENAQKEYEEKKSVEDYESRFKNIPAWKRALIERKEIQAREEAASNKK